MKMKLDEGMLMVADLDNTQFAIVKSWNLMVYNRKMRWMEGPATAELLNRFASIVRLPVHIENERQRLNRIQAVIDRERMTEDPVPICKFPVKANLFKHQIRAVNMALITFGLIEPQKMKAGDLNGSTHK